MADYLRDSYAQLPYQSEPMFDSHPDQVATTAFLAGLSPAPVEKCRVLELGCAQGGNLVGMAEALPESEFVGVDLAPNQIAQGRAMVGELGLKNVMLEAMNLRDVGSEFGQFDYIVAHGLLAWVAPALRETIMKLCRDRLTAHGLAYISYATFPGWRQRGVAREGMLYHIGDNDNVKERLAGARAFIRVMAESVDERTGEQARLWQQAYKWIVEGPDYYIAHEYLEEFQEPVYFHEFAALARQCGLEYVGDARESKVILQVEERIEQRMPELGKDRVRFEQYVDFAFGRQFRRSVVCRAGLPVAPAIDAARVMECFVNSTAGPVGLVDLRAGVKMEFRGADGLPVAVVDAVAKAAMMELAAHAPVAVRFETLWEKVRGVQGSVGDDAAMRRGLADALARLSRQQMVRLRLSPSRFVRNPGERPTASRLARWQVQKGESVTSRRHQSVTNLTELDRKVLGLLDGTRDLAAVSSAAGVLREEASAAMMRLGQHGLLVA